MIIICNYDYTISLDNLCTWHELEQIMATQNIFPLPREIEAEVLQNVMVLLVNWNANESLATRSYLQPLDGHHYLYKFDQGGHVSYYIGKYGACPAAVIGGFELHGSANTVSMMADQCFPNLGAIISVGVTCGIKDKVQLCDVLVSSKIINYDKERDEDGGYLPRGEPITVSHPLLKLFTAPVQWPNNTIKKRLNDNGKPMPNVRSGVILSGPYLVNDPAMKTTLAKSFAHEVIGIEMKGTQLFTETQETMTSTIIVKAVCDFGNGKNNKEYQPTAALLAADLVHKCLSDPQALEILKGLHNLVTYIIYGTA